MVQVNCGKSLENTSLDLEEFSQRFKHLILLRLIHIMNIISKLIIFIF